MEEINNDNLLFYTIFYSHINVSISKHIILRSAFSHYLCSLCMLKQFIHFKLALSNLKYKENQQIQTRLDGKHAISPYQGGNDNQSKDVIGIQIINDSSQILKYRRVILRIKPLRVYGKSLKEPLFETQLIHKNKAVSPDKAMTDAAVVASALSLQKVKT